MTFIQGRINVDATSRRCIDVDATLYKPHVPAGQDYLGLSVLNMCRAMPKGVFGTMRMRRLL